MVDGAEGRRAPHLFIPALSGLYAGLAPLAAAAPRVAAGLLLMPHGAQKLFGAFGGYGLDGTGQFMASIGLEPGWLFALAAGLVEFVGGALLALGLLTRPAAVAVAVLLGVTITVHWPNGLFWTDMGFEYPLFWAVVALSYAVRGGGGYSLD
ncbi:MAG: DoxX family protein, partial [Rhodospirillaceae bacterium]|nr:DoxX family protein [Rhodospirillaceae bacterium]